MRRLLDGLYWCSGWLAGICMVAVLFFVVLTIVSRYFGFAAPGADSYAGYATAGAGFMALASTLKHGEHIRVTLLLGVLKGKLHHALEAAVLALATVIAGFLAWYSVRLAWQSLEIGDVSMGLDATPMWIPQLFMAAGTIVFFIAFCDELVLQLLGRRSDPRSKDAHHE